MPGYPAPLAGGVAPLDPHQRGQAPVWTPQRKTAWRCRMNYDPPHMPPAPPSPASGEGYSEPPPKKKKRSGSEKRQRDAIIPVRCKPEEAAAIRDNAAAARQKPSGFLRSLGTGQQRPNERRPSLPELAPFRETYGKLAIACSNAAQLLRLANRGEYPDIPEVRDTHTKLNAAADQLLALMRGYSGDR